MINKFPVNYVAVSSGATGKNTWGNVVRGKRKKESEDSLSDCLNSPKIHIIIKSTNI